jgi:diphosphate--fructose-6-phosphate 1-phosphotransferase
MEIALSVKPNVALIGEEISDKRWTLKDIVSNIADVICARAHDGKNFGTIVLPEGLLAAVPETRVLISELAKCKAKTVEAVLPQLSLFSAALMQSLPDYIQQQLVLERQSNGVVQLSQVQTDQLISDMVAVELAARKKSGDEHPVMRSQKQYVGSFSPVCQFLGYQARTSMPSNFDSDYGRALGATAAVLASTGCNGYFASVSGLANGVQSWRCAGAPIAAICSNTDFGVRVVPSPVPLQGPAWHAWSKIRAQCAAEDNYCNPGPIQFAGENCQSVTETLRHRTSQWGEAGNYLETLDELREKVELLCGALRPGCETSLARVANRTLGSMEEILALMSE